jgi:prepilin-type N-terminal cleavage/methylation domain-containing protein
MKKLTSKKGFTLVEMLVVIAIIAVLVAIIIPTVTTATKRAAAATNAANLRSYKAELSIALLTDDGDLSSVTGAKSKKCGDVAANLEANYKLENDVITVFYGGSTGNPTNYTIDYFADIAGDTASATTAPANPS